MQIRLVFCLPVIISTSWEREKEGMTWAYVVILGLDGFNWQPRLLRTQICIWASLCSVGSQGSSAWILHLFFWVSCGAGPGNKALPSCFHVVKEPPCTRWRGGGGEGGPCPWAGGHSAEGKPPERFLGHLVPHLGPSAIPWLSSPFSGSQAVSSREIPHCRAGGCLAPLLGWGTSCRVHPSGCRLGWKRPWFCSWSSFNLRSFQGSLILGFFLNQNGVKERATGKLFPKTKSHCRKWRAETQQLWCSEPRHWNTADPGTSDVSGQSWLWPSFWREILRSGVFGHSRETEWQWKAFLFFVCVAP